MSMDSIWTGELSLDRLAPLTPEEEKRGAHARIRGRRLRDLRAHWTPEMRAEEEARLAEEVAEMLAQRRAA